MISIDVQLIRGYLEIELGTLLIKCFLLISFTNGSSQ